MSSNRRPDGAQEGFTNGVEQVNEFVVRGDERRQMRGAKGNDFGSGDAKGGDFGKGPGAERGRISGGIRRQERDNYSGSRNSRGTHRNGGRGSATSGGRGDASNFASRGPGFRNVSNGNSQMNGSSKGHGNGGGLSGFGYNGPQQPQRR